MWHPPGSGNVNANPPPNCATNANLYAYGTKVTLSGAPDTGYAFTGWTGDASGSLGSASVTMTAAHAVTATFAACLPLLTSVSPANSGAVSSNPTPNCQGGGTDLYNPGTQVQLTAQPATNYAFGHWGSDAGDTPTQTTITLTTFTSVAAHFQGCVPVTTAVDPPGPPPAGSASVITKPNCPGGGADYAPGSTVVLTTTSAGPYFLFDHWTVNGAATLQSPTSAGSSLVLGTGSVAATAEYSTCKTLTISAVPPADGGVSAYPAPNCGPLHAYDRYLPGTPVTLTARAGTGFVFTNWSGDASGSNAQATLTMNADHSVTANFQGACFGLATNVAPPRQRQCERQPAA